MNTSLRAQFRTIQSMVVHFPENPVVEETQDSTRGPLFSFSRLRCRSWNRSLRLHLIPSSLNIARNIDDNPLFLSRRVIIKTWLYAVFSSFVRSEENSRKSRSWEEPTNRRFRNMRNDWGMLTTKAYHRGLGLSWTIYKYIGFLIYFSLVCV